MTTVDLSWKLRAQKAETALAKCGGDNCMGQAVEGCRSWVSKERLLQVQAEAESSAALVKELAQNFELLYSRVTLTEIKAWFGEEDGRKLVCTHRKAESLLSHPAVQKAIKE